MGCRNYMIQIKGCVLLYWSKCESKKTGGKEGDRFLLMEKRAKISFPRYLVSYPAAAPLCGLLLWYSTSSTVQTAPFTFSTRIKHLWRDKLWRTAFYTTLLIFFQRWFFWKGNKFDILTFCSFTWPEKYEIFSEISKKYSIANFLISF